jgi:WD40 repeat protein
VDFSPDGQVALTGGKDGTVRLWNPATGRSLQTFGGHRGAVNDVAFSAKGERVATAGEDGTVRVFKCELCGSVDDLLGLADERATRDLTGEERARYLHR